MNDYPIHVGSMLFTMVDPHVGKEVDYNRWYERDHYYGGCMIGPYLFAGSRWVATRALKDLRFGDGSGEVADPIDKGSYLAIYWVEAGHHDDHFSWASTQVHKLYAEGRGFPDRTHAHTILADTPWAVYRDADPIPIEIALDHRYAGLGVVGLDRTEGTDEDTLNEFLRTDAMPALMADSAIASGCSWRPEPRDPNTTANAPMDLGTLPGGPERQLQLFFLDDKPEASWDRFRAYADRISESGLAVVRWAAPFYPTIIGTDTYTDQLWD